MSVLICVKSKHGCSSGMISWTFEFVKRTAKHYLVGIII